MNVTLAKRGAAVTKNPDYKQSSAIGLLLTAVFHLHGFSGAVPPMHENYFYHGAVIRVIFGHCVLFHDDRFYACKRWYITDVVFLAYIHDIVPACTQTVQK